METNKQKTVPEGPLEVLIKTDDLKAAFRRAVVEWAVFGFLLGLFVGVMGSLILICQGSFG